jgi:hypothetical protein
LEMGWHFVGFSWESPFWLDNYVNRDESFEEHNDTWSHMIYPWSGPRFSQLLAEFHVFWSRMCHVLPMID